MFTRTQGSKQAKVGGAENRGRASFNMKSLVLGTFRLAFLTIHNGNTVLIEFPFVSL